MTAHISSADLLTALGGAFTEWTDVYTHTTDPAPLPPDYAARLERARAETGLVESVRVGETALEGRRVALVVSEFAFLGGSVGTRGAAIIAAAVRRATARRLPVLASPVSGGTRMQEGAAAALQLATIALALGEHRAAGLAYVTYLRSPTTGGVLASWGSLGHVTLAQPEAFLAFLGPRVVAALTGETIPDGVQRAEHLLAAGVVDRVVPLEQLAGTARDVLAVACADGGNHPPRDAGTPPADGSTPPADGSTPPRDAGTPPADGSTPPRDGWADVLATRGPAWPDIGRLVACTGERTTVLAGPGASRPDGAAYVALTWIEGSRAMVVGFRGGEDAPCVGAADLARLRRAVEDAESLRLPVVSVVDLVGGELSEEAEEAGVAREIARCLAAVVDARVPTVSVLLGKGSGGAALAIAAADAVVALEGAWLAPLPPEGASAIVYRDTVHAAELARGQGITARDLAAAGGVDEVVGSLAQLGPAIARALRAVGGRGADERHAARVARYARLRAE